MKTFLALLALIAVSVSLCLAAGTIDITSTEAKALLAKNKQVVLLDVRTPEEFRQAHLRGALLIPLAELQKRVSEIPRDRPLLVYCAVGARSSTAAAILASKGHREIYHMSDGLVGWYKQGFPIVR